MENSFIFRVAAARHTRNIIYTMSLSWRDARESFGWRSTNGKRVPRDDRSSSSFKSLRVARSWAYHNGSRQRNLGRGSHRHTRAQFIACLYPSRVSTCAMRRAWVMSLHRSSHTYRDCGGINKYPGLPPSFSFSRILKNYSLMGRFYILGSERIRRAYGWLFLSYRAGNLHSIIYTALHTGKSMLLYIYNDLTEVETTIITILLKLLHVLLNIEWINLLCVNPLIFHIIGKFKIVKKNVRVSRRF